MSNNLFHQQRTIIIPLRRSLKSVKTVVYRDSRCILDTLNFRKILTHTISLWVWNPLPHIGSTINTELSRYLVFLFCYKPVIWLKIFKVKELRVLIIFLKLLLSHFPVITDVFYRIDSFS